MPACPAQAVAAGKTRLWYSAIARDAFGFELQAQRLQLPRIATPASDRRVIQGLAYLQRARRGRCPRILMEAHALFVPVESAMLQQALCLPAHVGEIGRRWFVVNELTVGWAWPRRLGIERVDDLAQRVRDSNALASKSIRKSSVLLINRKTRLSYLVFQMEGIIMVRGN